MVMIGTVLRVFPTHLLVRDINTGQTVQVNFRGASRFSEGDRVRITYNGVMTRSNPPQITATNVQRISSPPAPPPVIVTPVFPNRPGNNPPPPNPGHNPGHNPGGHRPPAPPPSPGPHRPGHHPPPPPPRPMQTITAIILQVNRNSLLVWNLTENRLMQVDFPNATQFRPGQLVRISFNTMTSSNPPRISALSVSPA